MRKGEAHTAPIVKHVYGAYWDWANNNGLTKGVRTDDAVGFADPNPAVNNGTGSSPFDNIWPWSGMVKEEDPVAGTLVKIPKFWFKWETQGKSIGLKISDAPKEGFYTSPAHADRGDGKGERDYVYVGRYHCGYGYKSATGNTPITGMSCATFRSQIHSLGDDIYQYDFAMYWTIMMLYLCEYSEWNSREALGYGCSPNGNVFSVGLTDAMKYHTGTSAATRTTYGCVQYRNIEGLMDNVMDCCDGIRFSGANVYCIKNPAQFSDTANGTLVGTRSTGFGWISGWTNPTESGFEYALVPNELNGSETTYVSTSYYGHVDGGVVLLVGSRCYKEQQFGHFGMQIVTATNTGDYMGCRLQKLP